MHNNSLAYDTKQTIICLETTLQMLFTVRHAVYQNNVTTSLPKNKHFTNII